MLANLAEKAKLTEEIFNTVPGIKCNPVQGAMYTFPRITLPQKAINKAKVSAASPHLTSVTVMRGEHVSKVFVCRRLVKNQTCTTVCACWRRRGSAWYLEVALVREKEPSTSGQYWEKNSALFLLCWNTKLVF